MATFTAEEIAEFFANNESHVFKEQVLDRNTKKEVYKELAERFSESLAEQWFEQYMMPKGMNQDEFLLHSLLTNKG